MPEFSSDEHRQTPRQFKAGPGQLGVDAARRGLRSPRGAEPSSRRSGQSSEPPALGLPKPHDEAPDVRHVAMGLHAMNANQLGRSQPFGIWFLRNGHHLQLPGYRPLDWLDV